MRTNKEQYYLELADVASSRSTCLRRGYGAIIVNNDEIIATGYNGAPRGRRNCDDIGYCTRKELNIPAGERYELCRSVHAESNAIISASRQEMIGATLYLAGREMSTGESVDVAEPCAMCKRLIINAGIENVVAKKKDGSWTTTTVRDWIFADDSIPSSVRMEQSNT